MNISLGDTEISTGDVSDGLKAASSLSKSLPGMAKKVHPGIVKQKVLSWSQMERDKRFNVPLKSTSF